MCCNIVIITAGLKERFLIHSPPTGWKNWPINKYHISNLNWRQSFPCQYNHVFQVPLFSIALYCVGMSENQIFLYSLTHLFCTEVSFYFYLTWWLIVIFFSVLFIAINLGFNIINFFSSAILAIPMIFFNLGKKNLIF